MKVLFLPALLSMALAGAAHAATPESAPVEALDTALIAAMKSGTAGQSFATRAKALAPVVAQTYNLPVVTQNSVGFLWSTLPAAQQQQLTALIGQFTTASYVSQFMSFGGEHFVLSPAEKPLGKGFIIQTQLVPGDGSAPVELDYAVQQGAAGWGIDDVLLSGTISQVAVHESDFAALVSAGDASRLISALQGKITALQSGTAAQ